MNHIDCYLDRACRSVSGPIALRKHLREELKEHLEEAIEALVATGMSQDDATTKVIADFGEPEMVREGLHSVYGQSVTSLFIDKAMEWKERTMKSEWKWSFAAQFGLVVMITLTVMFIASAFRFIVPMVVESHDDMGASLPDYLITLIDISYQIQRTVWIWLVALAGALVLFEWRCRSENKALIRTTIGVGASLVLLVAAFYVAAAIVIPVVQLRHSAIDQPQEPVIIATIVEAHESYKRLGQAVEDENWPLANEWATRVRDAYRSLHGRTAATAVLAGAIPADQSAEIRRLMVEIAEAGDELHDAIRDDKAPSVAREHFLQLKESYSQLAAKSPLFASHVAPEVEKEPAGEEKPEANPTTAPDSRTGTR